MVRRLIRPAGIIFKGSGFYVTDHRPQESKAESSTAEPTKKKESYETKGASAEDCG
jgi:predicted nucleic acid-binding Zn ribbon protein